VCRRFELPKGAFDVLSLDLMIASQNVAACLRFLEGSRPSVIVTEADRLNKWSCLVLAARQLRIPTVTMVHGVMHENAVGYTPVLADSIVCWGNADRTKLVAAGEPPEKIVVGGCPRLSRDLRVTRDEGRARLALNPHMAVAMLASSPEQQRLDLAELFCSAFENLDCMSAVVRLHASETRAPYAAIIKRHPRVLFIENADATLDDCLAAADVVVVHSSGVGGDALVKGRPVVVIDRETIPSGHGADLIEQAGCPHVQSSSKLADVLLKIILDANYLQALAVSADRFVSEFCSAFGPESARLTACIVRHAAEGSVQTTASQSPQPMSIQGGSTCG